MFRYWPEPTGKRYNSAVDWWLVTIPVVALLSIIITGIVDSIGSDSKLPLLFCLITGVFIGVVMALLSVPCHYTLTGDALIIKCGLFGRTIPLNKIHDAEKSYNPLSSPALSLKRIAIRGANGKLFALISPKDRDVFIADLKSRLLRR